MQTDIVNLPCQDQQPTTVRRPWEKDLTRKHLWHSIESGIPLRAFCFVLGPGLLVNPYRWQMCTSGKPRKPWCMGRVALPDTRTRCISWSGWVRLLSEICRIHLCTKTDQHGDANGSVDRTPWSCRCSHKDTSTSDSEHRAWPR